MLEIIDLAKRYGSVVALDGASFTARPGRIVGFLGPNGAGKTTTMRCIFGLASPDRGEVRWAGAPVGRDARLRFGYMPEQRGLYPRMRVGEQLSYFAQQHGLRRQGRERRGGPLARADGPRRPRQVEAGGAVARQPAARPARDGARPRPGAAGPRRAVLRPRPDRHRDDDRGHPRAGRGRRRRGLLQPPARPGRGRLRGRRDHRPGPDRRRRRHRGAQDRVRPPAPRGRGRRLRRRLAGRARRPDRPRALERRRSSCWSTARSTSTASSRWPAGPARSGRSPTSPRSCPSCSWKRSPPTRRRRRWPDEPLAQHLARRATGDPRARPQPRVHLQRPVHDRDRDRLVRPDRVPPRRRRPGQGRGRRARARRPRDHAHRPRRAGSTRPSS